MRIVIDSVMENVTAMLQNCFAATNCYITVLGILIKSKSLESFSSDVCF